MIAAAHRPLVDALRVVVMGASHGGLRAMKQILASLPPTFRAPIILVQHRAKESDETLAHALQEATPLSVQEAEDKQPVAPGNVYLAPADYHLLVDGDAFALSTEEAVFYSRPSIDVAFESAAEAFKQSLVAVVLTGANRDGTRGLRRVKELGGYTVAQAPETAESAVMPAAAIASHVVDRVLSLEEIAPFLAEVAG